jgi:hypothetical protein
MVLPEAKVREVQCMKDNIDFEKAAQLISRLSSLVGAFSFIRDFIDSNEPGNPMIQMNERLCTALFADIENLRDYFLYEVQEATKETALSLIERLMGLQQQAQEAGDIFQAGFFLALAEFLDLKHGIGALSKGTKRTNRQDFELSFNDTKEKYGLEMEAGESDGLNRKSRPTGYVV